MKKSASLYFLLGAAVFSLLLIFFSTQKADAALIYYQPNDNAATTTDNSQTHLINSFVLPFDTDFRTGNLTTFQFSVSANMGAGQVVDWHISTTSAPGQYFMSTGNVPLQNIPGIQTIDAVMNNCGSNPAYCVFPAGTTLYISQSQNYPALIIITDPLLQMFGQIYSQGQNPINFGGIYFPYVYSTSSVAIASSSSLWGSLNVASTTQQCETGNVFQTGFCTAMAFLFLPNPDILNGYVGLFSTSSTGGFFARFPGNYIVGVSNAWGSLSASSTANLALVEFDFPGVSTTTPGFGGFIPDKIVILSTSTISQYFSPTVWNALQYLISAGLWLGLATNIFFTVRNKMHRV